MRLRGRMGKGLRRCGAAVDLATARERALSAAYYADGRMQMSAFACVIWPDSEFRAPQGAAFAASPVVRGLHADGLLRLDGFGYRITSAGKRAMLNGEING